jgi:hypothetical protein
MKIGLPRISLVAERLRFSQPSYSATPQIFPTWPVANRVEGRPQSVIGEIYGLTPAFG